MSLARKLLNQVRNPSGWFGRWQLRSMNRRHSQLTDWGLEHISVPDDAQILDIGCGGGRTIHKLATRASTGKVYGVDYSETSVVSSQKFNQQWIDERRVDIRHGSVSQLPFPDGMFDLATAIETHFYWPNLLADMREVLRVLKPGGVFLIIAEVYKGGKHDRRANRFAEVMGRMGFSYAHLSLEEHRALFLEAGFDGVLVNEQFERGWICARGKRPS
jgi:ubiquinone/menaquinone biosynthesis C-methylase UbiE